MKHSKVGLLGLAASILVPLALVACSRDTVGRAARRQAIAPAEAVDAPTGGWRYAGSGLDVHSDTGATTIALTGRKGRVRLSTDRVKREGWEVSAPPIVHANPSSSTVVERVQEAPGGIEQSWHFPERPGGKGDLEVSVAVEGAQRIERDRKGLRFEMPQGHALRYSDATWVTANGERHALKSAYEGGRIRIRVPQAVVDDSAYPAVLDPTVSDAVIVDPDLFPDGKPVEEQRRPTVARSGSMFLAAWADYRVGVMTSSHDELARSWATRIATGGKVLDPTGFHLSDEFDFSHDIWYEASETALTIGASSGGFLAAWLSQNDKEFRASLVDHAGMRTPINLGLTTERPLAIGGKGDEFLLVYDASNLKAQRLNAAGVPIGKSIPFGVSDVQSAAVATDGTDYMVFWTDHSSYESVGASRILPNGTALPITLPGKSFGMNATIAYGSGRYMAIAGADAHSFDAYSYIFEISSNGQVLSGPLPVLIQAPSVAFDGSSYVMAYHLPPSTFDGGIKVGKIGFDGSVTSSLLLNKTRNDPPSISCTTSHECQVVWGDEMDWEGSVVRTASLKTSPTIVATEPVYACPKPNSQGQGSVARSSQAYLIAWADSRHGRTTIEASRIDLKGAPMDHPSIELSLNPTVTQHSPSVASDGSNWLVTWSEFSADDSPADIRAVRVSAAGAVLDSPPLELGRTYHYSSTSSLTTFDGSKYVTVLSTDDGLDITSIDPASGAMTKTSFRSPLAAHSELLSFACLDRSCIAIGIQDVILIDTSIGEVSRVAMPAGATGFSFDGQVVAGAGQYYLIWNHGHIFGSRVDQSGTLLDAGGVDLGMVNDWSRIAWDGVEYVVLRAGNHQDHDYVRVTPSGEVSAGRFIAPDWIEAIASPSYGGETLIVTSDVDHELGAQRVLSRVLQAAGGAAGSGGAGGEAGAAGAGGAGGSGGGGAGGAAGSGGAGGSAGTGASGSAGLGGTGGASGSAETDAGGITVSVDDGSSDEGGCGCRTVGSSTSGSAWLLVGLIGLLTRWTKRRF